MPIKIPPRIVSYGQTRFSAHFLPFVFLYLYSWQVAEKAPIAPFQLNFCCHIYSQGRKNHLTIIFNNRLTLF